MLLIFLNSSSSPPQPTPSCATLPWSSPGLAPLPVPSSDNDILECRFPLDATIPCSYQEEALSSSPLEPSSDPTPSSVQSSSPRASSDPDSRASELVQQFNHARSQPNATAKRKAIRDKAKALGLHRIFQQLLQQKDPLPEPKCSDRI